MSATVLSPPNPTSVHFNCQSCDSTLEVPKEYLGVSGPCPYCGKVATAPTMQEWLAMTQAPVIPAPLPARISTENRPLDPRTKRRPKPKFRRSARQKVDGTGPSLQQILGWATMGLVLVAGGLAISVIRYTEPINPPRQFNVPKDLTEQVMREKERVELVRASFINQSVKEANQFLAGGTAESCPFLMFSPAGQRPKFEGNLFPDLKPTDLVASACTRKPGTEEFLVTVEPKDGRGPVLLVEQQAGKPLLHADAFQQQVDDTLNTFLDAKGDATVVAYVLARNSQTQFPLTELRGWPKLDIQNAFPSANARDFIACAGPGTEAAEAVNKRRESTHWTRAVMEFRWAKSPNGNRFIQLIRVIPNAWGKY